MRSTNLQILLTLATAALGAEDSNVFTLSSDDFSNHIASHDIVLAEFYAPWCGHCQALEPEYEKAADALAERSEDITLAKVDCTENNELCSDYEVRGFPTLHLFENGEKTVQYSGPRKADDITNYLIKRSQPAVIDAKSAAGLDEWLKENLETNPVTFGFFGKKADYDAFASFAAAHRDRASFIAVTDDKDLAKKYGGDVAVFRHDEPHASLTSGKINNATLTEFFQSNSFPSFGELGPDTYYAYVESKLPMLYAFVENLESRELVKSSLKPHLKETNGKVNIVFLDATLYPKHADNLNLREEFPAIAIHDIVEDKKYIHEQDTPLSSTSISKFISEYLAGKIEPKVKTAPVPETQDEPVYVLVGSEYEKVVIDNDKDVLVEFYAPWCGHCKTLKPKYDQLGELFEGNEDVVIAKLDHTANEVPVKLTGYPTIMLFPAGKKDEPIEFSGNREVEDLAKFIEENGTKGAKRNAKKPANAKITPTKKSTDADVKKEL